MRYFFDTEFWDTGERIYLISIGIAAEDGRTYYREVFLGQIPRIPPGHWLTTNVIPHLSGGAIRRLREDIAREVVEFVGDRPEFWAYVADYDWIALSQLYGPLVNRPKRWPWPALDAYQLPDFKKYVTKDAMRPDHHALADAANLRLSWLRWREAFPDYPLPEFRSPRE